MDLKNVEKGDSESELADGAAAAAGGGLRQVRA
jgi:hypothetical protein